MSIRRLTSPTLLATALLASSAFGQSGAISGVPFAPAARANSLPSSPQHLLTPPSNFAQAGGGCEVLLNQTPTNSGAFYSDSEIDDPALDQSVLAEDITLASDKEICDLTIWGAFAPANGFPPGSIQLLVHEDEMGLPGPVVYSEFGVPFASSPTGDLVFGLDVYEFTLTPTAAVLLNSGTTYWFEIYYSSGTGTDDFVWIQGNPDPLTGSEGITFAFQAPGEDWLQTSNNMSIVIRGTDPFDPCQDDDFLEDNDDCGQEIPLGNGFYPGLFASKTDWDYFSLSVAPGDTVDISVSHIQADGDIDAFLYPADMCADFASGDVGCTDSLACGYTLNDVETLSYTNTSGVCETYILKINVWPPTTTGDCNNYDLTITGTVGSPIGFSYCDQNANSTGEIARITALGSPLPGDNQLSLVANRMPADQIGYFIVSQTAGLVDLPGLGISDGFLCLGSGKGRYNGVNGNPGAILNSGAAGTFCLTGLDTNMIPLSSGPSYPAMVGTSNYFTAWFRDPSGVVGNNFTDAVEIPWEELK